MRNVVDTDNGLRLSRSWLTLSGLALATVALRMPFLAPMLAHWDAVNYALGLHAFEVAAHQPHPPGSPYFILLGRLALLLVGDDNRGLELVSLVASVGAVLTEYALARLVFGKTAGLLAALVLMTQPVFWGYGTVATAWTVLAWLSIAIGLTCALLLRGRTGLVYPSALLLGIGSGFRADATLFLAPLWLWSMATAVRDWRRRCLAIGLVVGCILMWLVPVAINAGGALAWSERLLALLPAPDRAAPAEARQLAANTAIAFGTLAFSFGPLLLVALVADFRRAVDWLRGTLRSRMGVFWALWILPAFTFLWLVDSTEPGHDLVYVGGLVAFGSGLVTYCARGGRQLATAGGLVVAAQALVFLFAAPVQDRPLAWTADSMLLNVTAPGIRQQQRSLADAVRTIRAGFDPADTQIVTLVGQDPYRYLMYYLPEFRVLRLDPSAAATLNAQDARQGDWTAIPDGCLVSDASVRQMVWVLTEPTEPGTTPDGADPVVTDTSIHVLRTTVGADSPEYLGFRLNCANR